MSQLDQLHDAGQATWLNYMRRAFIESGELRQCIRDGIQGITANAAVFADTITHRSDYDEAIHRELVSGTAVTRIHEALMADDVQRAADILHPVHEASGGLNGFASLELNPALAHDATETVAEARHLLAKIDRGNAMVEIPATLAGCAAIQTLTADGVSINATHIFSTADFERAAQAVICGLERYFDTHSVWRIAPTAVASFSVAPIDAIVDPLLADEGAPTLQHQTGLAVAQLLYGRFCDIFRGPRWQRLARHGAHVLRPKWTRLEAPPELPATYYVDALVAPDTVQTFTRTSLAAFQASGNPGSGLPTNISAAEAHLEAITAVGIDLEPLLHELQKEHLAASEAQYRRLQTGVGAKLQLMHQI